MIELAQESLPIPEGLTASFVLHEYNKDGDLQFSYKLTPNEEGICASAMVYPPGLSGVRFGLNTPMNRAQLLSFFYKDGAYAVYKDKKAYIRLSTPDENGQYHEYTIAHADNDYPLNLPEQINWNIQSLPIPMDKDSAFQHIFGQK